jgi:hypothetical protein
MGVQVPPFAQQRRQPPRVAVSALWGDYIGKYDRAKRRHPAARNVSSMKFEPAHMGQLAA